MVDKHIFAQPYEPAEIGMERCKHYCAGIYFGADDVAQAVAYQVNGSSGIQWNRQPNSPVYDGLYLRVFGIVQPNGRPGFQSVENVSIFAAGDDVFF